MRACHTARKQYTVAEAAIHLSLCEDSVYDLVRKDLITHGRKGPNKGRIFFFKEDLDDYLGGKPNRRNRKK